MARLNVRDFGTSLHFASSGTSRVDITNNAAINNITNTSGFTVSMRVKRASAQTASNEYLLTDSSGTKWFFRVDSLTGGLLRFYWDGSNSIFNGPLLRPGAWEHVVVTLAYSGTQTTATIYYNGVSYISRTTTDSGFAINGSALKIGNANGNAAGLNGYIDDVFLWNRTLTATEAASLYANTTIPSGVIGAYTFDEASGTTAKDSSGNGNDGTITGAAYTTDVPMVARSTASSRTAASTRVSVRNFPASYKFDGSSSKIVTASDPFSVSDTAATISFWAKIPASTKGTDQTLMGNGGNNTDAGFAIRKFTDGNIYTYHNAKTPAFTPRYDQWNHYVLTITQGVSYQMYENGVLKFNQTGITSRNLNSATLQVGVVNGGAAQWFGGFITRIKAWKTAFTAQQVSDLYNSELQPLPPSLTLLLEEGSGTTANDGIGTNNGTITNGAWSTDTPMKSRLAA